MLQTILLYIPLSIIGLWRWSYWLVRMTGAVVYRRHVRKVQQTPASDVRLSVAVVTPVYNEDEALFEEALQSWIANGVNEIIAVIDKTNTHHILNFERNYVPRKDVKCRLIVTPKPGKRAALCDGIERATSDLVALVDSDTIWNKDVRAQFLPYFADDNMGGVTVAQRIANPNTISNVIFDMLLWNRYHEEVPFLLGLGHAYNTLSGRTAVYRRTALINKKHDNIHYLTHEFFINARAISGDDKRLSHLILEQGWKVEFAPNAVVYTQGMDKIRVFLKQRLRWTRNSWRADLRAVKRRWVFRYPVLAYFMIDRFVQPFLMLLGPVAAVIGVINHQWLFVGVLVAWWLVSRTVRLFSYFKAYPKRLVYLPAQVIYTYVNAGMKIYALMTILENSWATRWHKSRMKRRLIRRWATLAVGVGGVVAVIAVSVHVVTQTNKQAAVTIPQPPAVVHGEFTTDSSLTANIRSVPKLPANATLPTDVKIYVTQQGDTLLQMSKDLNMDMVPLKKLNGIQDPDKLKIGTSIMYYATPTTEAQQ